MPAFYIKYPNSDEQVFKPLPASGRIPRSDTFILSPDFLNTFGELQVPRHIWFAMCSFASWIEPALVSEWIRLMQFYSEKHNVRRTYDELDSLLIWLDPVRDTNQVRDITARLIAAS